MVLVADAGCLERSLILALQVLEVQKNAILCLNLMDEAAKKGIEIDVAALERELGIPVIPCAARQGKGLHELEAAIRRSAAGENETHPTAIRYPAMDEDLTEEQRDDIATAAAALRAEEIALTCVRQPECACARDDRADDVILSRRFGVPLMLLLLAGVFYLTLFGANVPSEWLSTHLLALGTPFAGALASWAAAVFRLDADRRAVGACWQPWSRSCCRRWRSSSRCSRCSRTQATCRAWRFSLTTPSSARERAASRA